MDCSLDVLSKKINLISSDEAVFEVDYGTALVSKRFEDIIKTIPVGDVGNISVHEVRSKMLAMVIEYCKMHKHNNGLKDFELKDWDAQFVNVDPKTLLDLLKSACYLRVDSLVDLTWNEVDSLIKGKTREEIAEIFGAVDDSNSKLLEENNEQSLQILQHIVNILGKCKLLFYFSFQTNANFFLLFLYDPISDELNYPSEVQLMLTID